MEDDSGMATDREAEDHFGRREERQEEGFTWTHGGGIPSSARSERGLELRPETRPGFGLGAAPNRCKRLGGVWKPAQMKKCTKFGFC